jgi:hypothetical protein
MMSPSMRMTGSAIQAFAGGLALVAVALALACNREPIKGGTPDPAATQKSAAIPPPAAADCATASATNLLKNPGLDRNVDGFAPGTWDSSDAAGCPSSGSLHLEYRSRSEVFGAKAGTRYFVGFSVNTESGKSAGCDLEWCNSSTCGAGLVIGQENLSGPAATGWQTVSAELVAPADTVAGRLTCGAVGKALFDRFYLSDSVAKF